MSTYLHALRHPFLAIRLARRFRKVFGIALFSAMVFIVITGAEGLCAERQQLIVGSNGRIWRAIPLRDGVTLIVDERGRTEMVRVLPSKPRAPKPVKRFGKMPNYDGMFDTILNPNYHGNHAG
jgi:hypothetical protein